MKAQQAVRFEVDVRFRDAGFASRGGDVRFDYTNRRELVTTRAQSDAD
jgi:hypothetical protein